MITLPLPGTPLVLVLFSLCFCASDAVFRASESVAISPWLCDARELGLQRRLSAIYTSSLSRHSVKLTTKIHRIPLFADLY